MVQSQKGMFEEYLRNIQHYDVENTVEHCRNLLENFQLREERRGRAREWRNQDVSQVDKREP